MSSHVPEPPKRVHLSRQIVVGTRVSKLKNMIEFCLGLPEVCVPFCAISCSQVKSLLAKGNKLYIRFAADGRGTANDLTTVGVYIRFEGDHFPYFAPCLRACRHAWISLQ